MKKFWVVAGICLMLICIVKAVDPTPTPPAYQIILQDVVYGGDLTLTSNIILPHNSIFEAMSESYHQSTDVYSGATNMSVVLDTYQPELFIAYDIFRLIPHFSVDGMIKGYSLKGQALSDTTVEVSWINHDHSEKYTVEDSTGTTAITVECSDDDYCYGYFTKLPASIGEDYKATLTPPTEPPLTTTITSTIIPSVTETTELPQLTLLTFHRTDEETMEVCFEDADPPIITDTSTPDQVTFTFTINGKEQHSRTALELKKINNTIHCASFDVKDLSEFTEAFALVGELSVHDPNDLQMNIGTIFTSFQMPGSMEIPSCSSAAILMDDSKPFAIVECRENDELDGLTIVTASEGDPISFLQADVIIAAKIVDNTTYYLGLSTNVGSNNPTKLYISKEIDAIPPLSGTVQVYSGPTDDLHLIAPMENPTTEQAVVYNGSLTLTFGQPLTDNVSYIFEISNKSIIQTVENATNVEVDLINYVIDQDITYLIYDSANSTATSATIKGYSLKAQALSDTTVEVSWINHDHSEKYTVEDSIGTPEITVECSDDDYCYGYFTNLPASIEEDYKATLTPPTEPLLTTTITSATILPFTETMEVPQLTLLAFHRTDETTLEVCFEDADPPMITDSLTEHQDVSFTFTINGTVQHSRTALNMTTFNNTFHCASFDVTDLSEFTEAFALVGQLSIHDPDHNQTTKATIFTSFPMPGSMEIPECSSAAVWNDEDEPIAIVVCTETDNLDNITIVTASADDPISFLHAVVNNATKIADNTYYLDLSANVGSNISTTLYVSKEITVNPPLTGTVQVYSGPTDNFTLINLMENPITAQAVVYGGNLTLTFTEKPADNLYFAVESNGCFDNQTIAAGAKTVEFNLTSYVINKTISYFIYDSANASSASETIKGYSLKGQALSDTKVEVSWINCDQNSDYIVEDSTGSTTIIVECGTDDYCYGYFTTLSPPIGDEYRATLTPTAVTPNTTITSMIISAVTKDIEIHVQEVHLDWSNDLRMVETEICFQHTSAAHSTNEAAFDYEGVIINSQGEWRRGQGLGKNSEGNSCLKPLVLDTESFSVRGEMTVIVLKRAQDGRTVLASGETTMFFDI